jgi:hypothetical protein
VPHVRYIVEIEIDGGVDKKLFGIVLRDNLLRLMDAGGIVCGPPHRKYRIKMEAHRKEKKLLNIGIWPQPMPSKYDGHPEDKRCLLFRRTKK